MTRQVPNWIRPGISGVMLLLISLLLDTILIVTATPPLHTRDETLNKQGGAGVSGLGVESGSGNRFQSKSNGNPIPISPVAEFQLEQLKLNPNTNPSAFSNNLSFDSNTSSKPLAPSKGTLNLETPAVSDNSLPQPEGSYDGTDYNKIVLLSKVESDKRMTDSLEKSSTSLKIEMDYTPQDIAEYIFWTGDEPGVVSALNDFLQDELVDKDEVIKFLENVKVELKLLKSRYSTVSTKQPENIKFKGQARILIPSTSFPVLEKRSISSSSNDNGKVREKRISEAGRVGDEEVEYDGLVQKMNRINAKLREDSLQEIIYRLAKELFVGGAGEHSIQKFAHFVEEAAATGHIPKDLEKRVLDTLVSALVDSVNEKEHRRPIDAVQNLMKH